MDVKHKHGRFIIEGHRGEAGFLDVMKWQFGSKRAQWPKRVENAPQPPPPRRVEGSAVTATWLGHSTVLVQTAGLNILTDPFLSDRASPLQWAGPKRVRPAGLSAQQLPPIDVVLVSHNHYDHMDLPALRAILRHHTPVIVTPTGNRRYLARATGSAPIEERGWYESVDIRGLRLTVTPALHWSKRSMFDANRALWGAFMIEGPAGPVYFAADTGFGEGRTFRDLRDRFGAPRLSLLPIGAYEPRWFMKAQHMNPHEAVTAHELTGSRTSLAIHHGTIQLTDEAIDAPVAELRTSLRQRGIDPGSFRVPDVGEPLTIP